ncbi:MAG: 3-deoxy-D-manno-octulosonic acid transferase, partial [Burkholderiaceae bacterium]|nr:3-deoxy-D-manno-octulosonic acid transferase [Burkholderiaceae bacterium]
TIGRPVVLAASTREGEEAALLSAWAQMRQHQPATLTPPRPLLLIVPRHPQRFDEVAALIAASGLTTLRRSTWADAPPPEAAQADVWLGDSIGEMATYYSCAQVALLGGSFEPLGGQNLIEAAACGCPVLMGPHTFNFADAAAMAQREGAAMRVDNAETAVRVAMEMLTTSKIEERDASTPPGAACASADRALVFASRHRGAAQRMAQQIAALISASATLC